MKSLLVFNENYGVVGVRSCQPHGQKSGYEGEGEKSRQQHVQTERGVEIKFVGLSCD